MGVKASSHAELSGDDPRAQRIEGVLNYYITEIWTAAYGVLDGRTVSLWEDESAFTSGKPPHLCKDLNSCKVGYGRAADRICIIVETQPAVLKLMPQTSPARLLLHCMTEEEGASWLASLQIASRPPWQDNSTAIACPLCNRAFDAILRKHHCRRCGDVFCESCSGKKQTMPMYAYSEPVRVCKECFGCTDTPVTPTWARGDLKVERKLAAMDRKRSHDSSRSERK